MGYFSGNSRHILKSFGMKSIFNKAIGKQEDKIPKHIKTALDKSFNDASCIEWTFTNNYYEALFYRDMLEYIAKINPNGEIFEYRINQSLDQIPGPVKATAVQHGEVMNCINIYLKDKEAMFEIIVRDDKYDRYVMMISIKGESISKIKL